MALVALLLSAVFYWPAVIVGNTTELTQEQALKAENDVRGTLLTGIAGGLFLVTAFLSWRQIQVAREGHLTDRFAKAVEQLGARPEKEGAPDPLDVRLGGICSLERIHKDSLKDRETVVSVLAAFVREHSQPLVQDEDHGTAEGEPRKAEMPAPRVHMTRYPADLQVAMSVLGRLKRQGGSLVLDLSMAILRLADLSGRT